MSYESYVKRCICAPLGIKTMRLGRALLENRQHDEVKYYDSRFRKGACLYSPLSGEQVPIQYGAENFESFEAHGGWIASAAQLVRFASAFDASDTSPLLSSRTIQQMWARPAGPAGEEKNGKPKAVYYGCGWMVRLKENKKKCNAWHAGFIAGSEAILVHRWDGLCWAVLFNTSKKQNGKSLAALIDGRVHTAANSVRHWPDVDLFRDVLK